MTGTTHSKVRRRAGITLVVAAATIPMLAGAEPAAAKVVTQTVPVGEDALASAVATCPKGQRATGGGIQSTPRIADEGHAVFAQESRKIGQRSWLVTGYLSSGGIGTPPAATMTAIAYCLKKGPLAPKTKEVPAVATSTSDYTGFTTADAVCPGGQTVRAGGFSQPTIAPSFSPFGDTLDSYRVARGTWRVRMIGELGAQIASYAYCAKGKPPTEQVGGVLATGQSNVTATSPPCGKGRKAISGGFSQVVALDPNDGYAFAFFQLARVGKAWQTSAGHFGDVPTGLDSIVYCAKAPKKKKTKKKR